MADKTMTFPEAAKLLRTNFRGCKNEDDKAGRLSDRMRFMGDAGIWDLVDADGDIWEISALYPENKSAFKRVME